MRDILFIILIFIIGFCPAIEAAEVSLTLDEAVALALRDNRDILFQEQEVIKAKEKIAEANADLFPTLDFTAARSNTRGYYSKDLPQTTTQATLKQYLYRGGETINTIRYNQNLLQAERALLDKTRLETVESASKAFYTLLLARDYADLNKQIFENTGEHLSSAKERYGSGQASQQDIVNIEASLSTVEQAHEASLNDIESAQAALNNLLYIDANVRISPEAEFVYEPAELAYDEAFLKAMAQRPEIKQYQAQEGADKYYVELQKSANRPSIYASWDYYSRSTTSLTFSPARAWQDWNVIGITVSWPVFDGQKTKAKVRQAIADLKKTEFLKQKTIKDIAQEVKDSYIDLSNAVAKIDAAEADVKLYSENLLTAKEKYAQGIISSLDLSDADLKNNVSVFNKKQAVYDYITAKISFQKAQGGMQ